MNCTVHYQVIRLGATKLRCAPVSNVGWVEGSNTIDFYTSRKWSPADGQQKGSGELESSQKRFEYNVGSNGEVMFPKMLGSETEYPFRFGRADAAPIAG